MSLEARSALDGLWNSINPLAGPFAGDIVVHERSDLGAVTCTASVDPAQIRQALSGVLGISLGNTGGALRSARGRTAVWVGPRAWLVVCVLGDDVTIVQAVAAAFAQREVHATSCTDALCWLDISGRDAEDMLRQGSFISLEPQGLRVGHARHTLLAGIRVLLERTDDIGWRIAVQRSHARYLVDWFASSAR